MTTDRETPLHIIGYDDITGTSYGVGNDVRLMETIDGWWRVQHPCKIVDLQDGPAPIVCAPELTRGGHTVTRGTDGLITVNPSILCPDCGLHGFVRKGRWTPA